MRKLVSRLALSLLILFILAVITRMLLVYYVDSKIRELNLVAAVNEGMTRDDVLKIRGEPCSEVFFKCCGIDIADQNSTHSDRWSYEFSLGNVEKDVYYDKNDQVITEQQSFFWITEPFFLERQGYQKRENECAWTR